MGNKLSLYFVAIVPGEKICHEITGFKNELARIYHAKHALKSPPHITLISPLKASPVQMKLTGELMAKIAESCNPFQLELNGFDFFEPHVIFVKVIPNSGLNQLKYELEHTLYINRIIKAKEQRAYHPHMTIAHRDLTKANFYRSRPYFENKKYQRTFTVKQISLLEHKNRRWEILENYSFGGDG